MQKGRAVLSDRSKIEWTDATWNPIIGCSPVSKGCDNCYAARMASRLSGDYESPGYYFDVIEKGRWNGETVRREPKFNPLTARKPRTIFVCSMGDLFHESVQDEWIDRVMAVIASAQNHRFMVLTKRPKRMLKYFDEMYRSLDDRCCERAIRVLGADMSYPRPPLKNLALGVSVSSQEDAGRWVSILLRTQAAYRFVSYEPALGPVDFTTFSYMIDRQSYDFNALTGKVVTKGGGFNIPEIDLVIMGGESGPNARPMHPDWARSVRDQCEAAGVPFHFKQWGEWHPEPLGFSEQRQAEPRHLCWVTPDGRFSDIGIGKKEDDSLLMYRAGKKKAGRFLDGQEHNGTLNW